jgi:uncharacterized protein DUF3500
MNAGLVRLLAACSVAVLLAWGGRKTSAIPVMTDTAKTFLAALTTDQRTKAALAFEDEERFDWHYIPRARKGIPLREMTPEQKHLAHALLSAGLSQSGYIKATTIMSLEEVLRAVENDSGERRNPDGYFFTIFGQPSESGIWGYRVEGHHLSLNFTIAGGRLAGAPTFFGANPAEVRSGPRKGLRALSREEDLARELLASLREEQVVAAIVDKTAYGDILTAASRKAALAGQPSGLPAERMTAAQRAKLESLLLEYVENLPAELAEGRLEKIRKAGGEVRFAWAGGTARGEKHYYRIQAPAFLVEYDNTQNDANHIHSVWRDLEGDFGLDLLAAHYRASHR